MTVITLRCWPYFYLSFLLYCSATLSLSLIMPSFSLALAFHTLRSLAVRIKFHPSQESNSYIMTAQSRMSGLLVAPMMKTFSWRPCRPSP